MMHLKVDGMHCSNCAAAVTRSVQALDPKAIVSVDLESHDVTVETTASIAEVSEAISDAGFDVTSAVK